MADANHHISVSEFKARCLTLLEDVAAQHHMLIITKFGKPIAKVSPIENTKPPLLGSWKGVVQVEGDIVKFDTSDEWEAVND
jgi:prevent-host-death family protein